MNETISGGRHAEDAYGYFIGHDGDLVDLLPGETHETVVETDPERVGFTREDLVRAVDAVKRYNREHGTYRNWVWELVYGRYLAARKFADYRGPGEPVWVVHGRNVRKHRAVLVRWADRVLDLAFRERDTPVLLYDVDRNQIPSLVSELPLGQLASGYIPVRESRRPEPGRNAPLWERLLTRAARLRSPSS